MVAEDAGPMEMEWEETAVWSVAEGVRQSTAEGAGSGLRQESIVEEAKEVENGVLFCVKAQRDGAR